MLVAGVDVGSVATKVVVMNGEYWYSRITPTGWSPRDAAVQAFNSLLAELGFPASRVEYTIGTGYGRVALPFVDKTVTEITCHGRGAAYLVPGATTIIDIGGQDSKVIRIDEKGRVLDFAMNDKCAAGTGRFLQVIASALGADVSELADIAAGHRPVALNSMCTVFAESEVIGLLASGEEKGSIVAGLHQSIARRIAGMVQRVGVGEKVIFTGGVAQNEGVRACLEGLLGVPVMVPDSCQLAGALGAALLARDCLKA